MALVNLAPILDGGEALLLFGSQALSFDTKDFNELFVKVRNTPEHAWIDGAIASLPECWASFVNAFPKYGANEGTLEALVELNESFQAKRLPALMEPLPNAVLGPLVVITHLVEYIQYLAMTASRPMNIQGVLGLCTGLLSAFAVSSSSDHEELRTQGANAVRLAMMIGGMVDAQEVLDSSGKSRTLAASWTGDQIGEHIERVLGDFPDVNNPLIPPAETSLN